MTNDYSERLINAWNSCREWITEIDGTPVITFFLDFPVNSIEEPLLKLSLESEGIRISVVRSDSPGGVSYIPVSELGESVSQFTNQVLNEISFDYSVTYPFAKLDIHFRLYWVDNSKSIIEIVWWNDQLFSEDSDLNNEAFNQFITYLYSIQ